MNYPTPASSQPLEDLIALGQQALQANDLALAEILLRQALQIAPRNIDALHLLGVAAHSLGKLDTAIELLTKAIGIAPSVPSFHLNLGNVFKDQGRLDQAAASYRAALQINPNYAKAYNNLGVVLKEQEQIDQAIACFSNAISLMPNYAEAYLNLAQTYQQNHQPEQAIPHYLECLRLNPGHTQAYSGLARACEECEDIAISVKGLQAGLHLRPESSELLASLGNVYLRYGFNKQAADAYSLGHAISPSAFTCNNLANALQALERFDEAIDLYHQAIELDPQNAGTYNNLGTTYRLMGKGEAAMASYRKALSIDPDYPQAWLNLGNCFMDQGQSADAIKAYRESIRLYPDYAEAHTNLATMLLQTGKLDEGWVEFNWRWKLNDFSIDTMLKTGRWWDGGNLKNKTLLIRAEQGVGDEIMFASMFPEVISAAAHCIIECDSRLIPLFARSFPQAEVIPRTAPLHSRTIQPDIDLTIPAGSLARFLRPTIDSFSQQKGYLTLDTARQNFWQQRVSELGQGTKVGICWRSGNRSSERRAYYSALSQWDDIFAVPGLIFVNLQYDECEQELLEVKNNFKTTIHRWPDLDLKNDFENVAALISALDLVISAPTAVANLAGSLGATVWNIYPAKEGWPMLGTNYMPWYPSMRLFCKSLNEGWEITLNEIAQEIALLANRPTPNDRSKY